MSRVRGKDTRPELRLRHALWAAGVRGWRCNVRKVFGAPDLAWQGRRVAIFVDPAWWHGHPSRWAPGRLSEWWDAKIERNRARDAEVTENVQVQGWTVVRLWDFEIEKGLDQCVARVRRALADGSTRRSSSTAA